MVLLGLGLVLVLGACAASKPAAKAAAPAPAAAAPASNSDRTARADGETHARLAAAAPFEAPLARAPLDTPLVLNGGFGEFRSNHFHAGLDLGTGGRVGRPVYAPLSGWIERVRASGVGYGRSIYLRGADGRLLVFAHLDAYAPPLAAFVAAAQESSGQYEQDLWPAAGRFKVTAGQRIAWTGESGAGGPHLHFEIRRGDLALNPLRAGLAIADTSDPTLVSVTLEPLDEHSYVERSAAPLTVRLDGRRDTVRAVGRLRAVVATRDGIWRGVDRMVPWSVALEYDAARVECRFDSVSWATDMAESDYLFDTGRVAGEKGFVMWAPPGFRPRIMRASAPAGDAAGTLNIRYGDPPRALKLVARDVAGRTCERTVVLKAPAPGQGGPDTTLAGGRAEPDSSRWWDLALLSDMRARVTFRGAPAGSRAVTLEGRPASLRDGMWTAVVPVSFEMWVRGRDGAGRPWSRRLDATLSANPAGRSEGQSVFDWILERGATFESGPLLVRDAVPVPDAPRELVPRSSLLELMPSSLPLRQPLRIEPRKKSKSHRVGLYADQGEGWSWLNAPLDSASGRRVAETRHLGRFALFEDTLAPRITPFAPAPGRSGGAYQRWALEARVREGGSGVDARASWIEVDGRRVPTEWDPEQDVLRWRPLRAPGPGTHRVVVVATDRAGNSRRATARFTLK